MKPADATRQAGSTGRRNEGHLRQDSAWARLAGRGATVHGCLGLTLLLGCTAGCAVAPPVPPDPQLRELATRYVERAMRYRDNPVVRAQAMEAAGDVLRGEALLAIRDGLHDDHPGVRFSACMALGKLADRSSLARLQASAEDADASVRVGAYYALERLGDGSHRQAWRQLLRSHEDPCVRRNAALALGRLGDKSADKLLWVAAVEDDDESVRLQALEALALLGDRDAVSRFIHDAYGGVGARQAFAMQVLGHVRDVRVVGPLRSRLKNAPHLTSRLAAARGLGMHGYDDGYALAVDSLNWNQPQRDLPDDPPLNQVMRVRSMASLALGAIGDRRALGWLRVRMEDPTDARVQLAAATAILVILNQAESPA